MNKERRKQLIAIPETRFDTATQREFLSHERFLGYRTTITKITFFILIITTTGLLVSGGMHPGISGNWKGILACFWFIFAGQIALQLRHEKHQILMLREFARIERLILETRSSDSQRVE